MQEHHAAGPGHALGVESLLGEDRDRHVVDRDGREGAGMVAAPPRVLVHPLDEPAHRGRAVPDDLRRMPAGRGDDRAADDEQAMIGPLHETLHDDRLPVLAGDLPGPLDLVARGEVHRHAAALVAVSRLHRHGGGERLGEPPGLGGVGDRAAFGDRDPGLGQQCG